MSIASLNPIPRGSSLERELQIPESLLRLTNELERIGKNLATLEARLQPALSDLPPKPPDGPVAGTLAEIHPTCPLASKIEAVTSSLGAVNVGFEELLRRLEL